ncbi:MAG: lamin tail domain-containing protein [Candidatus Izemoplasmatales bacterium]|nr:lamin tail domain-containing protein [Candidatus Izemoplasmatales bacterium]
MKKITTLLFCFLGLLSISYLHTQAAEPTRTNVSVSINAYFDATNKIAQNPINVLYGRNVSLSMDDFSGTSGYEFAFWIVDGIVRQDLSNINQSFKVTSNTELTAIFRPTEKVIALFLDVNGKMIDIQYVNSGTAPASPNWGLASSKPGLQVKSSSPWDPAISTITSTTVYQLQYEPVSSPSNYDLIVTNGSGSENGIQFNTMVTVIADTPEEGYNFLNWTINGVVVSYMQQYAFTLIENTTIVANYTDTPVSAQPVITITNNLASRSGYNTHVGRFELPSGYTVLEFGFITISELGELEELTLNTTNVKRYKSSKALSNGEFIMSIRDYDSHFIRAYLVVEDSEDDISTHYSIVTKQNLILKDLFISEYGEGSSNNKWIEIYNPTSSAVDLSLYSLVLYPNGSSSPGTTLSLTGSISSGGTYLVVNSGANSTLKSKANIEHAVTNFNGNDALALLKGGSIIDQFGVIGKDPGTSWSLSHGSTADYSLVRKFAITSPSSIWIQSEWLTYATDNSNFAGAHGPDSYFVSISGNSSVLEGATIQLLATVYPLQANQSVSWSSDNQALATVSNGVVSGISAGAVSITASSTVLVGVHSSFSVSINSSYTPKVVIVEVYGGGGNASAPYKNDYVVLFNQTNQDINLTNYHLWYASATGTFNASVDLTGKTIKARSFFLINLASGGTTGANNPTGDASGSINLSGTAGKVALTNTSVTPVNASSLNVVDYVGFGTTANSFEGTGPTPAPSNTLAAKRTNINTDTNDNKNDFTTGAPTPKNSSSPTA